MYDDLFQDANGPSFTLSSQWGSPSSVAEITEWSDSSIGEAQVEITGPSQITIMSDLLKEKFTLTGWEDLEGVRWIDWMFEYKDEYGEWRELDKVTKEGEISKLDVDGLDVEAWSDLAASIGVLSSDKKILDSSVTALVISDDEKVLATSNAHDFEIVYYTSLRLETERDFLEVYPTGPNRTRLLVSYGKLNLEEHIRFEALNAPPSVNIEFEPVEITTDLSGVGKTSVKLELDFKQLSMAQLRGEEPLPVEIMAWSGSLEKTVELWVMPRPLGWLLMFYVATDTANSLQEGDVGNLEKIEAALMAEDPYSRPVKVGATALMDLHRDWDLGFEMLKGGSAYILKSTAEGYETVIDLGHVNMGDGGLLKEFVGMSQAMYPSLRTMLVIVDHGDGMIGACHDLSHGGSLSIDEIGLALMDTARGVDIIAFDACYMGQLEVVFDLAGVTSYIVASQIAIPGVGLTYPIQELLQNPKMSPQAYGELMVDSFSMPKARPHQLALIDCSVTEVLVETMNKLAGNLIANYGEGGTTTFDIVSGAIQTSTPLKHPYYDLYEFAESLRGSDDLIINFAAQDVKDVLSQVVLRNKALIYDNSGRLMSSPDCNGLSFFLWPSGVDARNGRTFDTYMEYYDKTGFSKMTRWKEFMDLHRRRCEAATGTYLSLDQVGHELYPHVYDGEGRHVGRNPDHWSRTRLDLEIPGATYFDFGNGTKVIGLPGDLAGFTFKVDGMSMEEAEESYRLTYSLVEGDEVIYEDVLENPIEEYTNHTVSIQVGDGEISLGEVSLERAEVEPVEEPEPQPSGGIPGFPRESIAVGIIIGVLLYWVKRRN